MYVTADSGLLVRNKPSLKSTRIFHLPKNSLVYVKKETGVEITIKDEGKEIKGEWYEIYGYSDDSKKGYVFNGFLTKEMPEIWYSGKEAYSKSYFYDNLKEGTFESQSKSKKYLNKSLPIIESNLKTLKVEGYLDYFNPNNQEIVLFENHNLKDLKPIGKLNNLAQVEIDSTFYKVKYKNYTNCVWNRIKIEGKYYYTDIDIHDFSFSKKLSKLKQKVFIVGQNDGYDGAYHLGYPEYFFLIFTDTSNNIIKRTKVLDFYLNDEFAMEEDISDIEWNVKNESYDISLIGHEQKITINWNGENFEIKKAVGNK